MFVTKNYIFFKFYKKIIKEKINMAGLIKKVKTNMKDIANDS